MKLNTQQKAAFLEAIWAFYAQSGRVDLPWRLPETDGSFDPYKIMVSELMLQQTQVARVIPKYDAFLQKFPTVHKLAAAELGDVLRVWQGLGYNRRAKFLWQAAQVVVSRGAFPDTAVELVKLPGVGVNTAGAILTYTYNLPVLFVETNIRTVYIHHFLADRIDISDKEIVTLVHQTLDHEHPREFYWALMDQGTYLKATVGNLNQASKHYVKQSSFQGSRRQLRGQILRVLGKQALPIAELQVTISDERLEAVLAELMQESLVHRTDGGAYAL